MLDNNDCLSKNIFLADDDEDDRMFFEDAVKAVCEDSNLVMAKDGSELMNILQQPPKPLPDVIFLDLNMPAKDGFQCLEEIKSSDKLKDVPVVIISTTSQPETINKVYNTGAHFYICKPNNFAQLKRTIKKVLTVDWALEKNQPPKEKFVISVA